MTMAILLAVVPGGVAAQVPVDTTTKKTADSLKRAVAPDTATRPKELALLTTNDLYYTAGLFAGTALVSRLDQSVAENLGDSTKLPGAFRKSATTALNFLGVPGSFIIAGGLYAVGKVASEPGLARTGVHTGEAIVLAEVLTEGLKFAVGRERPYVSGTSHPWEFSFGRGVKGELYSSFPSGHASAAFATAAAVTAEVAARYPHATIFVAPVLYTGAAMVGWARLSDNVHWLSDVFFGAGIGTFMGVKVVRYAHKHPNNWIDRILVGAAPNVVPDVGGGGVKLIWVLRPKLLDRGFTATQ